MININVTNLQVTEYKYMNFTNNVNYIYQNIRCHWWQVLLLEMVFKSNLKLTEFIYLPDVSRRSIVNASTIYSKTPLILRSFSEQEAQQIVASVVIDMNFVGMPKLGK